MSRALVFAVVLLPAAGCLPSTAFHCDEDGDCGAGGRCERTGLCSVADPSCDSGRRYGDAAGEVSGQCTLLPLALGGECQVHGTDHLVDSACAYAVCVSMPGCCDVEWDDFCVEEADRLCDASCATGVSFGGDMTVTAGIPDSGAGGAAPGADWRRVWLWDSSIDPVASDYGDELQIRSIAWADYDGDGDPDLAIGGECWVHILENQGYVGDNLSLDAVYSRRRDPAGGPCGDDPSQRLDVRRATWVDVDDDGDLDVAFAGEHGLFLVRNDDGAFTEVTPALVPDAEPAPGLTDMAWGDADDDGDLDLAVASADGPVRLWRNTGGSLAVDATWVGPDGVQLLAFCDVAVDGGAELLAAQVGGKDSTLLGFPSVEGALRDLAYFTWQSTAEIAALACADLDGDGRREIVVATRHADGETDPLGPVEVLDGDGHPRWSSSTGSGQGARFHAEGVDVGDLDGDGAVDIVVSDNPDPEDLVEPFAILSNSGQEELDFGFEPGADLRDQYGSTAVQVVALPLPPP